MPADCRNILSFKIDGFKYYMAGSDVCMWKYMGTIKA